MKTRSGYDTDLTDAEWGLLAPLIPDAKPGGRPEKYSKRDIINGIRYVARTGCAWRLLPNDFPAWTSVYHYFRKWRQDGTWKKAHDRLRGDVRVEAGRERQPSAGVLDSQSVKTTEKGGSTDTMPARRLTVVSDICLSM